MADSGDFSSIFPAEGPNPYNDAGIRAIESAREKFGGELFIDRILKTTGIGNARVYYPPQTKTASRRRSTADDKHVSPLDALHAHISQSQVNTQLKTSLLYYLVLDLDAVCTRALQRADSFATQACLTSSYRVFMRGLWCMDHGDFSTALVHLTHPSLPCEFADDILTLLVRHAPSHSDVSTPDYTLALSYYHTTQPVLRTSASLLLLFTALSQTSIPEALLFSRARSPSEPARRVLFERLLDSAVSLESGADVLPSSSAGRSGIGKRARELVAFPLDAVEDVWFAEYFGSGGAGSKARGAAALLEMRSIVAGRRVGPVPLRALRKGTMT